MKFKNYVKSLGAKGIKVYAQRVGCAESTLIHKYYYNNAIPLKSTFIKLYKESDGKVSRAELAAHFYS